MVLVRFGVDTLKDQGGTGSLCYNSDVDTLKDQGGTGSLCSTVMWIH